MELTVMESGAVTSAKRSPIKTITCPACGQPNLFKAKLYYWLLSKEKQARCRNCGRSIRINP